MDPVIAQIVIAIIGVIGSVAAGWVVASERAKVHQAVLEQRLSYAEKEILSLRAFRHEFSNKFAEIQMALLKR